jgi:hypothetical protein
MRSRLQLRRIESAAIGGAPYQRNAALKSIQVTPDTRK